MKNRLTFLAIASVFIFITGTVCMTSPIDSIVGTWESEVTDSSWGPLIMEYTFKADCTILCSMRPADPDDREEGVTPTEGHFKLDGNKVLIFIGKSDDVIRGEVKDSILLVRPDDESEQIKFKKKNI